jgi:phosphoglycerol transferase MdoB-like AlkP superfamily enzyme
VVLFYLLLLLAHVAHIMEEVWGRFWLMNAVYGLGWFLVVNWVLFCVPVAILYFLLLGKRWAYFLGMGYAGLMVLNGIGHNVATIATGRYFDGFAGGYSGIALVLVGSLLLYALRQELATTQMKG